MIMFNMLIAGLDYKYRYFREDLMSSCGFLKLKWAIIIYQIKFYKSNKHDWFFY